MKGAEQRELLLHLANSFAEWKKKKILASSRKQSVRIFFFTIPNEIFLCRNERQLLEVGLLEFFCYFDKKYNFSILFSSSSSAQTFDELSHKST